jgi:hypothetical protein
MNVRKLVGTIVVVLCLALLPVVVIKTMGQEEPKTAEPGVEQWEYLAVAGPSTTNLTATNNPRMRKEPNVPFGREAFVLEQHLDKLGANGWELVAIGGPPNDPAYYFKRPRRAEASR